MKNWIIGALVAALTLSAVAFAFAQSSRTANVEVRVWEDVNDPLSNYISARPEGGSWRVLGTISLPLDDGVSSSGRFRYGDITLAVPLPDAPTPATPSQTVQTDVEITNIRCESQRVGRYYSDHDRTLRGTIKNVSGHPITRVTVYASLLRDGAGVKTRTDGRYDLLSSGSGWNFEIDFFTELGDECRIWKVIYEKTVQSPQESQSDLEVRDLVCGEEGSFGEETLIFTLTNVSDAFISDIDAVASVYGESSDDVDSDSSYGVPGLAPGEETVVTIDFDDFEGDAHRCALDTLTYKKEIRYVEEVPYE